MSDEKTKILCDFINRRTSRTIEAVPLVNRISVNYDIRNMASTFDFDVEFRQSEKVPLRSHDFVEFYFFLKNVKHQIFAGFLEDLVKDTGNSSLKFQANGRDFLGQLFNIPFLQAKPYDSTNLVRFTYDCVRDAYLPEYMRLKRIGDWVKPTGSFGGALLVPELTDAKRAPVLQQTADEVFNVVYQNRFGQAVIWGRGAKDNLNTGLVLQDVGDPNVMNFQLRESYSKVYSEVKVLYTGGEANIDYALTPSAPVYNSEPRARQIFQPEIRTFQTSTLVTTAGQQSLQYKKENLAASILRRSNQNLYQVVIKTSLPYYITGSGQRIPYEHQQLWQIKSKYHDLNENMRLVGIGYSQDSSSLTCELAFIPKDSLV